MTLDRQTILSFSVVFIFAAALFLWILRPPEATDVQLTVLNMLLGALIGAFVTVIGYDFGSSSGSKSKEDAIIAASVEAAKPTPSQPLEVTVERQTLEADVTPGAKT